MGKSGIFARDPWKSARAVYTDDADFAAARKSSPACRTLRHHEIIDAERFADGHSTI